MTFADFQINQTFGAPQVAEALARQLVASSTQRRVAGDFLSQLGGDGGGVPSIGLMLRVAAEFEAANRISDRCGISVHVENTHLYTFITQISDK